MDARSKTAPRVALVLIALVAGGGEVVASPYYQVTNLGTGWDSALERDGQGGWVLENQNNGATLPFSHPLGQSHPFDEGQLPLVDGWQGIHPSVPRQWEMRVSGSNALGTVIGGYPDGSSLAIPYSSMQFGYVTRRQDGGYEDFVRLGAGSSLSLFLNAKDQILFDRWKLYDIATSTTTNLLDLIPPEMIEQLGPLASRPDAYRGFALGDDGSILAKVQDFGGERTLLLTPPTHAPEPSTLALFVAVGASVAHRRYRRD